MTTSKSRQEAELTEPSFGYVEASSRSAGALARPAVAAGRLGTYTALGAAAGTVPLPWVPDVVARRIRGALAQDVAARHGLSLTPEARAILAEPSGSEGPRGMLRQAAMFVGGKVLARVGPFWLLAPVRSALSTFALGHLLNRYLSHARTDRSVRIDIEEARRVRRCIDRAMLEGVAGNAQAEREEAGRAPEELRDHTTQVIDGLIMATAGLPGWLVRRLDAAFDDVLRREG